MAICKIAPRLATVRRPPSDFRYGEDSRWIEVAPPGAANTIALVPPSEGKAPGGNQTYCAFASEDIEEDHATLRARGVDVDAGIARKGKRRPGLISTDVTIRDPVPPQFFFRDLGLSRQDAACSRLALPPTMFRIFAKQLLPSRCTTRLHRCPVGAE